MTITRKFLLAVFHAALLAGTALPAAAQTIPADIGQQIYQELRAIRELLEAQQRNNAAPRPVPQAAPDDRVSLPFSDNGFSLGRNDAQLVMIEYTDYECPFCRQFHMGAFEQIRRNYIDAGKVRYVSRDFPLDMHKNAPRAAAAGRCAGEQGKFWELRHTLIVNAANLGADQILGYAKEARLDLAKFRPCLQSNRYQAAIQADMEEGRSAGLSGTPSFIIGRVSNGRVEGIRMVGAAPYINFAQKLDELLNAAKAN